MADISDFTLMIENEIESGTLYNKPRPHLGASIIGQQCRRSSWYTFRWCSKKPISPRLKRLFDRGHAEEIVVIADLINAGYKVEGIDLDDSIRDRFKVVYNIDFPEFKQQTSYPIAFGHGGGSTDGAVTGIPDAPKTKHVLEIKTANEKNYRQMVAHGVRKSKPQHFIQMQIYMKIFGLRRALYIMVNKNDDSRHYERIKYDKEIVKTALNVAECIVSSERPLQKIDEDKNFYLCRWCDHRGICHGNVAPEVNCRTCKNVDIRVDGIWYCLKRKKKLSYKKQLKACKSYKRNQAVG